LSGTATAELQAAIDAAVARLGRFGGSYPIHLAPPVGHEVVPATETLSDERIRDFSERAILEWTDHPEEEDLRAAISRFMRRYCGSMASAALVPLAAGVALDVALDRISFLIRDDMPKGVVLDLGGGERPIVSPERPTDWPLEAAGVAVETVATVAELRRRGLENLVGANLVPAFERVLATVHVSPKLLWSTAAEQIDLLYDNAADGHDAAGFAPFAADRTAILFGDALPGFDGPHPLAGLLEWETVLDPLFPRPLQVRRICCVNYVVPGRPGKYCRTCGLITPEERLAMWRSWKASVSA
jgi:ferric iron reductase protein FhuF